MLAVIIGALGASILHAQSTSPGTTPVPCITSNDACTGWVTVAGGPGRMRVYRTYPLDTRNANVTRAVIVVHGAGRDAHNYFQHALAGAFLAGALENTLVISPRFASNDGGACADAIDATELNWQCGGPGRWTSGGGAVGQPNATSFDAADEMLRALARKAVFPNLRTIVVAGHSAGGQFVSRYQMANQVHDKLSIPISYVVSNPSSYPYPDRLRPTQSATPSNVAAAAPGFVAPIPRDLPPFVEFQDASNCSGFNNWPYGLQNRVGYTAKLTDEDLKRQLAARRTIYLLGGIDILPLFGFDGSCSAMAQGPTRLARGLAFARYVNEKFVATHDVTIVPSCGHNARCMFSDNLALPLLFPKP
jgi:hypothetical protein